MDASLFASSWKWTQHPCWLWVASGVSDHQQATYEVLKYVLSEGVHNPQGGKPDEVAQALKKGFYPNWTRVVLPEGSSFIPIESVRDLFQNIMYKAPLPGWRAVVVEGPLNTNATNALLKTLEEPPAETLWILWASHWGQALPTLRSRCQRVRLPSFSEKPIQPLAWGDVEVDQKITSWGRLEDLTKLVEHPVYEPSLLKGLWDGGVDPWFVLDIYQRILHERVIQQSNRSRVEGWYAVAQWFQQAKAAHLDPAHSFIEGMRLWSNLGVKS